MISSFEDRAKSEIALTVNGELRVVRAFPM